MRQQILFVPTPDEEAESLNQSFGLGGGTRSRMSGAGGSGACARSRYRWLQGVIVSTGGSRSGGTKIARYPSAGASGTKSTW